MEKGEKVYYREGCSASNEGFAQETWKCLEEMAEGNKLDGRGEEANRKLLRFHADGHPK